MKKKSVLKTQSITKKKKEVHTGISLVTFFKKAIPAMFKLFALFIFTAGISLSLLYGYHYLQTSNAVKIEKVEVVGVEESIKNELIEMCDLAPDANLLFIDLKTLKNNLKTHPWVKRIKLRRNLPHTLFLEVEKFKPYALVAMDRLYFMDKSCELFKEVEGEDADYPVITGVSGDLKNVSKQLARAVGVISFLSKQQKPWSTDNLSEIHMKGHNNISLYFAHLPVKIITVGDNLERKISGLTKITKHLTAEGKIDQVTSIDLNSIEGAVVSFKKG